MTEKEMRDTKCPWPKSESELIRFIRNITKENDEYGKAVYCMSLASVATFQYMSHILGVTGFQASCADMDFLSRTRNLEMWEILSYEDMLYPQYNYKFENVITRDVFNWMRNKAEINITSHPDAHPDVITHWRNIVKGIVPLGVS